jgi:hypothetical protein
MGIPEPRRFDRGSAYQIDTGLSRYRVADGFFLSQRVSAGEELTLDFIDDPTRKSVRARFLASLLIDE